MTDGPSSTAAVLTLLRLIEDYHAFNPGGVEVLPYPTAVEFSKQVSRGRPCIYRLQPHRQPRRHGEGQTEARTKAEQTSKRPHPEVDLDQQAHDILSCPAFSWTREELCQKVEEEVEVAVTPDGRADSLYPYDDHEDVFVQPATISMSLSSVLEKICRPPTESTNLADSDPSSPEPVYYLQSQNSNLTTTPLSALLADVPSHIPFARPVLGEPEAVNVWMGNASSVTSTHRDPYENLYLVLRGKKHFTLWAPCEEMCLHAKKVRTAHHVYDTTTSPPSFKIVLDSPSSPQSEVESDGRIPWIPIDPLNLPPSDILASEYPYYQYSHPLTVTVSAGEMLYLPAGWFHHVRQECGVWDDGQVAPCTAVNYWFDMDYEGEKYVMREMLGRLVQMAKGEHEMDSA